MYNDFTEKKHFFFVLCCGIISNKYFFLICLDLWRNKTCSWGLKISAHVIYCNCLVNSAEVYLFYFPENFMTSSKFDTQMKEAHATIPIWVGPINAINDTCRIQYVIEWFMISQVNKMISFSTFFTLEPQRTMRSNLRSKGIHYLSSHVQTTKALLPQSCTVHWNVLKTIENLWNIRYKKCRKFCNEWNLRLTSERFIVIEI